MKIFKVNISGKTYKVTVEEMEEEDKTNEVEIANQAKNVAFYNSCDWDESWVADNSKIIKAPMAGIIVDVATEKGTEIKKGDLIVILEAMKMENELRAHCSGIVKEIPVSKGQLVNQGDIIMIFE